MDYDTEDSQKQWKFTQITITILIILTSILLPSYRILQWQIFWLNHLPLIQAKKQKQIIAVFNDYSWAYNNIFLCRKSTEAGKKGQQIVYYYIEQTAKCN